MKLFWLWEINYFSTTNHHQQKELARPNSAIPSVDAHETFMEKMSLEYSLEKLSIICNVG